jgi:hypothetical protein
MAVLRRHLALPFAVLLALRSLLPVGFMLAPTQGDGAISIVICTGHGPRLVTIDADGQPVSEKPAAGDNGLCPFAASCPLAPACPDAAPLPAPVGQSVALAHPAHADIIASRHGLPAPARGPPLKT